MRLLALVAVLSVAIGSCSSAPLDDDGAGRQSTLCGPLPAYHAIGTLVTQDQVAGDTVLTISGVTVPDGATIVAGIAQDNYTSNVGVIRWNGQVSTLAANHAGTDIAQSIAIITDATGGTADLSISFSAAPLSAAVCVSYVNGLDSDPLDDQFSGGATGVVSATGVNIEVFNYPSIYLAFCNVNEAKELGPHTWTGTANPTAGQYDGTSGAGSGVESTCSEAFGFMSTGFNYLNAYGTFGGATEVAWAIVCLKACGNNPGGL